MHMFEFVLYTVLVIIASGIIGYDAYMDSKGE